MINSNVTTPVLTADTPVTLEFAGAYPYYWVNNLSDNALYASLDDVPVPGADGTYTIPSGAQQRIAANISFTDGKACGKLSLLGEGTVQVVAALIADCPFKKKSKGGESSGGGDDSSGKIDYKKMPYATALSNAFTAYEDTVSPSAWKNSIGDTDFVLQNAVFTDNAMTMYNKSVGYLPITEPAEWTAYVLCRVVIAQKVSYTNASVFGTTNAYISARIHPGSEGMLNLNDNTYSGYKLLDWALVAVRKNADVISVFVNGTLVATQSGTFTSVGDKFQIKCLCSNGVTPTECTYNLTVQMKSLVICDTTHGDTAIAENSEWILSKFTEG